MIVLFDLLTCCHVKPPVVLPQCSSGRHWLQLKHKTQLKWLDRPLEEALGFEEALWFEGVLVVYPTYAQQCGFHGKWVHSLIPAVGADGTCSTLIVFFNQLFGSSAKRKSQMANDDLLALNCQKHEDLSKQATCICIFSLSHFRTKPLTIELCLSLADEDGKSNTRCSLCHNRSQTQQLPFSQGQINGFSKSKLLSSAWCGHYLSLPQVSTRGLHYNSTLCLEVPRDKQWLQCSVLYVFFQLWFYDLILQACTSWPHLCRVKKVVKDGSLKHKEWHCCISGI